MRQYMETVQRRQAREPGGSDDKKAQDAKTGSEGDRWRPKEEGDWVAAAEPPKLEPKAEVGHCMLGNVKPSGYRVRLRIITCLRQSDGRKRHP